MDALGTGPENPDTPDVQSLLTRHFDLMRALTPEEGCHVILPAKLNAEVALLIGVRRNGTLPGIGALKQIGPDHGELKSMHTVAEARGQGVARKLLEALTAAAKARGIARLSLETGTAPAFGPARALYAKAGFEECPPFADYKPYPLSVYMTKSL
ncbi:GNAT family N-acetyltransferase [Marimonas sp. MJW-29]|uniref:GNAT family N-acetyltransferase n=1 Tax=Sulfitobacter sediminis TaxID=3234186 RepID=A0ABV3RQ74_9RHOB